MSAESALLAGRAAAESLMVDACTINRATGGSATNLVTGVVTDTKTTVYAGKCRVQSRALTAQSPDAGEASLALAQFEVQVPMSVVGVRTGDFVTITASALDPDLVGRSFRVTVPAHKTHATARRFPCTEGGPDE